MKNQNNRENGEYLENGGGGSNERERGLNTTGGIDGESRLNELPLELVGGVGRAFKVTGILVGGPLTTGAPTDEGENSHCLIFEWGFCLKRNMKKMERVGSGRLSSEDCVWFLR